jgi:starvation-inducible outer membrane lipoprotein
MELVSKRWGAVMMVGVLAFWVDLGGCATKSSPIPSQYRDQVDPNVTYGMLSRQPDSYQGRMVALGGVIIDARSDQQGRTWLFVRNRPLDADFEPHIPVSRDERDAFWAIVDPRRLSMNFKMWARITAIGRITNESPSQLGVEDPNRKTPVLVAQFLHGWEGFGSYSPAFKNAVDDAKGSRGQFGAPSNLKKN